VAAALVDSGQVGTWADHLLATDDLAAPHLMPVEVANVLAAAAGEISTDTATLAHADLLRMRVELFGYEPFAARTWELRENTDTTKDDLLAVVRRVRAGRCSCG